MSVSALVVALIAGASSVVAAVIAFRAQQRVARLTASLDEQRAESDARRSYEYEARKRLYSVYEPLRLRMLDCTDNAVRQIVDIVGWPGPGRAGYSSSEYRLNATIYYLLAPLVVARMIERRLIGKSKATVTEYGLKAGEQYYGPRAGVTRKAVGVAGNHRLRAGARHAYFATQAASSAGLAAHWSRLRTHE
jgi:hypothetical protein